MTMLMLGEEMDMFINMNDLQIVLTLNSLLRLYQFGMYYLDCFTREMYHVQTENYLAEKNYKKQLLKYNKKKEQQDKNEEIEKEEIKKEYAKRLINYVNNPYTVERAKEHIKKRHKIKTLDNYIEYFADAESSKRGRKVIAYPIRNRSKMRIIFNMNNTMFKLPLDHITIIILIFLKLI